MNQCKDKKYTEKNFIIVVIFKSQQFTKKLNEQSTANFHSHGQTCTVIPRMPGMSFSEARNKQ